MSANSASVRVAVRLRPFSEREKAKDTLPVVTASTDKSEVTIIRGSANRQQKQTYRFDSVFGSFASQRDVFEDAIRPLVNDVMGGYEATVFAYGQTGTGKTHTMEGTLGDDAEQGVIPRAVEAIFDQLKDARYTASSVNASYLEIYNEELSDLLDDKAPLMSARGGGGHQPGFGGGNATDASAKRDDKLGQLMLLEEPPKKAGGKGSAFVKNLSEHKVSSPADVLALIGRAQERRRVGETLMNKKSSRSHCVFTLTVSSTRTTKEQGGTMESVGKLHLVDLAGSECAKSAAGEGLKKDGAEARERERKNINQSLLTLGRVISTLKDCTERKVSLENVRIPYRDSKLTRLLQESLGGRCKTVIIATLSPSVLAVDETFSTLNYAQQAHGIQNKPVATSYLRMTMQEGMMKQVEGANGEVLTGNSMKGWHELTLKHEYMKSQLEESQACLARKIKEQEDIEERAKLAEAAKVEAMAKLEVAEKENTKLTQENAEQAKELEVRTFLNSTRAATETQLARQAGTVLQCLNSTEIEASTLHAALAAAAAAADAQTARRSAFGAALGDHLSSAEAQVAALGGALEAQRSAMLAMAAKVEDTLGEHATAIGEHAAAMASAHTSESGRAGKSLSEAQNKAQTALDSAAQSLTGSIRLASEKISKAQEEMASKLQSVIASIESAQNALSTSVDAVEERQASSEAEAARLRGDIGENVNMNASEIGTRLSAEHTRFVAHSGALKVLLGDVGEARKAEASAREALAALKESEDVDHGSQRASLQACIEAIASAVAAQEEGQRDATLLDKLDGASSLLTDAKSKATSSLEGQKDGLSSALEEQHAGNAMVATTSALQKAREDVDAAGEMRLAEVEKAASKVAAQKETLLAMTTEQTTLRENLLKAVMTSVNETLSAQLALLAKSADSGVAAASATADEITQVGAAAAEGTSKAMAEYATRSDALLEATAKWGASNADVASRIEVAMSENVSCTEGLVSDADAVSATHDAARGLTKQWATSDLACRTALGKANEQQTLSMKAAAEACEARKAAVDAIDAKAAGLQKLSDAANSNIVSMGADVDTGSEAIDAAKTESDARATKLKADIEALGAASVAARKVEAAALGSLSSAAASAASEATTSLGKALLEGEASAKAHTAAATSQAEEVDAAVSATASAWTEFAEAEATARNAASQTVITKRDLAAGEVNLHSNAVASSHDAREKAFAEAAEEMAVQLGEQGKGVHGMLALSATFAVESESEPVCVSERSPHPFTETFARTAAEPKLREHYAANGNIPFEVYEAEGATIPSSPHPMSEQKPTRRLSLVDMAALNALNVAELRKMCVDHDLSKDGKKEELIQRLAKAGAKPPPATPRSTPRRPRSHPNVAAAADENDQGAENEGKKSAENVVVPGIKKALSKSNLSKVGAAAPRRSADRSAAVNVK